MTNQFGVIRQVAYVVEDMDQALKYWIDFLGAGPFYMFEHSQMDDQKYRGGDSQVDVSLAVGNSGDVQIELIYLIEATALRQPCASLEITPLTSF